LTKGVISRFFSGYHGNLPISPYPRAKNVHNIVFSDCHNPKLHFGIGCDFIQVNQKNPHFATGKNIGCM